MLQGEGPGISSFLVFNIQQTESIHSVVMDNRLEICEKILALSLTHHKNLKRNKFSWRDKIAIGEQQDFQPSRVHIYQCPRSLWSF